MSSKNLMILAAGVVIIALVAFFVLKGNNYPSTSSVQPSATVVPTTGENSATSSGEVQSQISIKDFAFNPSSTTVKVGTKVTWMNNDSAPHTITSDPDGSMFNSPTIKPGESFQFTFDKAGTFAYHCSIHASMQGTVIVTP